MNPETSNIELCLSGCLTKSVFGLYRQSALAHRRGMNPIKTDTLAKDLEFIENAHFHHDITFAAQMLVFSSHHLKILAAERGIPMEQITVEHIVQALSHPNEQIREGIRRLATSLLSSRSKPL
jgi:hypothetical protein